MNNDYGVVFVARVRTIQSAHPEAHKILSNWGLWAGDRSGIFPTLKSPGMWQYFDQQAAAKDGYGEEGEVAVVDAPVKAEASERAPFDEKQGRVADERIHGNGGLPLEHRRAIRAAYVFLDSPDYQMWKMAGCRNEDQFCELLESSLLWAARWR